MLAGYRPRISADSPAQFPPSPDARPVSSQSRPLSAQAQEHITATTSEHPIHLTTPPKRDGSMEVVDYMSEDDFAMAFQEMVNQELQMTHRNLTRCLVDNNRRASAAITMKVREMMGQPTTADRTFAAEQLQAYRQAAEQMPTGWDQKADLPSGSVVTVPGTVISESRDIYATPMTSFNGQNCAKKQSVNTNMAAVPVPLMIVAHRQPPNLNLPDPNNVALPPARSVPVPIASASLMPPGDTGNGLQHCDAKEGTISGVEPSMRTIARTYSSPPENDAEDDLVVQTFTEASQHVSFEVKKKPRFTEQSRCSDGRDICAKTFIDDSIRRKTSENQNRVGMHTRTLGGVRASQSAHAFAQSLAIGVFADAETMKEKVRAAIGRQDNNITNFYKESGVAQIIARSTAFEYIALAAIALNGIWIGIDTDHNKSDAVAGATATYQVIENGFCIFFTLEWMIRLIALRRLRDGVRDSWFVFDGVLVILMALETWFLSLIFVIADTNGGRNLGNASVLKLMKLLRLSRMARMVRLLRAIPELMILIKGISVATRSVFFTLCLLLVILYIFGIAFTQLTLDTPVGSRYFKDVLASMNTLLLYGVFLEDTPDVINQVGDEHWGLRALFLIFILLASLTVMNMLVGVLVEVVSVVSSVEKEQLQVNYVKSRLTRILDDFALDANSDGKVSRAEFEMLLGNPEAARALRDVGVDVIGLVDYHDFLFADGGDSFSFENFMQVVLSLRGSNKATVKDVVDLRKFVMSELSRIEEKLSFMLESCGATRLPAKAPSRLASVAFEPLLSKS